MTGNVIWRLSLLCLSVENKEEKMHHVYSVSITLAILATSPVGAQEGAAEQASPCLVEPVFHCVQQLDGGSAIGHFGYKLQCPEGVETPEDVYIEIGDDNLFSADRKDRGQPKVFLPGEHVDEFEVEFSLAEVKGDSAIQWCVLDQTATVDFSKTKDASLDCSILP
jgi:hypothetical protein